MAHGPAPAKSRRRRPPRAKKLSITVDAGVVREVKRVLRGTGRTLSAHVSEALARDLRRRRLEELLAEYEAEHGSITDAELVEARRAWLG